MMSWQSSAHNVSSNFKRSCNNKPRNNLKLKNKPNNKRLSQRILIPFCDVISPLMHVHD